MDLAGAGRRPLRLAAAVGLLLTGSALTACSSSSSGAAPSTAGSSPAATSASASASATTSALPPITALTPPGAVEQEVPSSPDWLVVAEGSAWGAGTAGLVRLDGRRGAPVSTLPVGGPVCQAMDVGYASIWLATCQSPTLVRVDPVRNRVTARIPLPITGVQEESSVAAGAGTFGVWVLSDDTQHIVRIDPGTNRVTATMAVPYGSTAARAGFGSLWLTNSSEGTLTRWDPRSGTVLATIAVGAGPRFLAVGETGVFTLDQAGGTVTHVDPATNSVVATTTVDDGAIDGGDIAVGGGSVWARVSSSLVAQLDPRTDTVVARFGDPAGSGSVAFGSGALWISAHDVQRVYRVARG